MKPILLKYIWCPACRGELELESIEQRPVQLTSQEREILVSRELDPVSYETEILSGRLACRGCAAVFPIRDGVPRMYKGAERDWPLPVQAGMSTGNLARFSDDPNVQATFSREWEEFDYEDATIWHWTLEQRIATFCEEIGIGSPDELAGKVMVDAGCGPAIVSMTLAERHGVEVIAMDLSFVLSRAFQRNRSNLCHFIQCSVLEPPLRPEIADLTYSHGVLHHTEDTKRAFDAVERATKPGGTLYVWLYGRKRGWNRVKYGVIRSIRAVNSRLPRIPQTVLIWFLAGFHVAIRTLKRLVGMKVAPVESLNQLLVVTRDRYTPKHAREHTEAEVKGWFSEKGYTNVVRRTAWKTIDVWNGSTDLSVKGLRPKA